MLPGIHQGPRIAPWERALTARLLKTAQQFIPVPGFPPLPKHPSQMPGGNPAQLSVLLPDLLSLAENHPDALASEIAATLKASLSDAERAQLGRNLFGNLKEELQQRHRNLDPSRVPVFFFQPTASLLNPGGMVRDARSLEEFMTGQMKSRPLYNISQPMAWEELKREAIRPDLGGVTYSWPQLRSDSTQKSPEAVVVMRGLVPDFPVLLTHEYGHAIVPPPRVSPELPSPSSTGEAAAMSALSVLLPRLAMMRSREPNTPIEARQAGAELRSNLDYNQEYFQQLFAPKALIGKGQQVSDLRETVFAPADVLVAQPGNQWWQTMDAVRQNRPTTLRRLFRSGLRSPSVQQADELINSLAYVLAYERLKPNASTATYADLLREMQAMKQDPKTKPLFDLIYHGPSDASAIFEAIKPIVERNPELKESPYLRRLMDLSADKQLFQYPEPKPSKSSTDANESSKDKKPPATAPSSDQKSSNAPSSSK